MSPRIEATTMDDDLVSWIGAEYGGGDAALHMMASEESFIYLSVNGQRASRMINLR